MPGGVGCRGKGGRYRVAFLLAFAMLPAGAVMRAHGLEATGGSQTKGSDKGIQYTIHTFTKVGASKFTVQIGGKVEVLIVGGGGGGGGGGFHPSGNGQSGGSGGGAGAPHDPATAGGPSEGSSLGGHKETVIEGNNP